MLLKNIKIGMTFYSEFGRAYVVREIEKLERYPVVAKSKTSGRVERFLPTQVYILPREKSSVLALEVQALSGVLERGGSDVRLDDVLMPLLIFRELAEEGYLTISHVHKPPEGFVGFGSITTKGIGFLKVQSTG
jgi:hypothetical protein